jgi:HrpA-like RNA helicase
MTVGIIVQQINIMSDEDFMAKYSHIIIDEAHERSTNTDTALFSLKKFIERNYKNPACPFLIVTSATFNAYKYADYLLADVNKSKRYENVIYVRGSTYPIERHYLNYDSSDFIHTTMDLVEQIHTENPQDFLTDSELKSALAKHPDAFVKRTFNAPGTPGTPKKRTGGVGSVDTPTIRLLEDEDPMVMDFTGDEYARVAGGSEGVNRTDRTFRDIIIFVSGGFEVTQLFKMIQQLNSRSPFCREYPLFPVQLTGNIVAAQSEDYRNLFADMSKLKVQVKSGKHGLTWVSAVRRVIIATNVAETGITIDTLRYVIDTGFVNSSEFSPNYNIDMLVLKPVTQGMHTQRTGRAGRKAPGVSYAVFTKETLDALQEDQYPDIIKEKIDLVVLNFLIKQLDTDNRNNNETLHDLFARNGDVLESAFEKELNSKKINIYDMDLLDLPSADALQTAMETLFTMGAINSNSIPTPVGFIMNKFRMVKPESVRMILAGYAWGAAIIDLVTIAAFLEQSTSNIFPKDLDDQYRKANSAGLFTLFQSGGKISGYSELKTQLFVADDFIRYVIIFSQFQQLTVSAYGGSDLSSVRKWCDERGVSYRALTEVATLRDNIISNMTNIGLNAFSGVDGCMRYIAGSYSDYEKMQYVKTIKQCIFEGYKLQIGIYDRTSLTYKSRKCNLPLKIGKTGVAHFLTVNEREEFGDTNPKFIIFGDARLVRNPKTNVYGAEVSNICILDGFISYDANFDTIM